MKSQTRQVLIAFTLTVMLGVPPAFLAAAEEEDDDDSDEEVVILSPFCVMSTGSLGATPGGAKDINFFRMGAGRGQIPHPDSLTAEGLFSEHDLPLDLGTGGDALFQVQTAAVAAQFEVLPEARYLAQLGFSSGLRADTWQRAPLNLVAVVDKSGSMSGEPLALVRASLRSVLGHLRDGDQLAIVLYGDRAHVHLATTAVSDASRATIAAQIDAIESAGSTFMEEGLRVGYELARKSAAGFAGTTRVMLFTDERPNVGDTSAESFMAMAGAASRDRIGLTTIGVGVQFGAELATRISSVRGGNLFFFEDGAQMTHTFAEDFDTMVTELAHEFSVRIAPAPGLKLEGVFGVPADMLRWDGDAVVLDVATIFLSRRKGAIYFALSPAVANRNLPARKFAAGSAVATIGFSYRDARDAAAVSATSACSLLAPEMVQAGLSRGLRLVDEYLTLEKAAQVHLFENNQETAFRLTRGLLARLTTATAADADLRRECDLVRDVHNTLALLAGHLGEISLAEPGAAASPLVGVWRRTADGDDAGTQEFLIVWPNGVLEPVSVERDSGTAERRASISLAGPLPAASSGELPVADEDARGLAPARFDIAGDHLVLRVAGWEDGSETVEFDRCSFSDLAMKNEGDGADGPRVDALSGLPVRKDSAAPVTSHRSRRSG